MIIKERSGYSQVFTLKDGSTFRLYPYDEKKIVAKDENLFDTIEIKIARERNYISIVEDEVIEDTSEKDNKKKKKGEEVVE